MSVARLWLILLALCPVIGIGAGLMRGDVGFGVGSAVFAVLLVLLSIPLRWLWLDYQAWNDDRRDENSK